MTESITQLPIGNKNNGEYTVINSKLISGMNACSDRYDNYVTNYGTNDYSISNFLDLDKITYSDKIWVVKRLMTKTQSVQFATLCAESVLYIFETKCPNDDRPRKCIEFLKSINDYSNLTLEQKESIKLHKYAAAAAYAADAAAAYAAAAYAAYAADYAADAAASAADYAAAYAAARKIQQNKIIQFLKKVMST